MTLRETPATIAAGRVAAPVLAVIIGGALAPASFAAGAGEGASSSGGRHRSQPPALRNGHELWATVDVCSSKPSPRVGIRGSMPPNGQANETMYMRFRVQYLNTKTKQWTDLQKGGDSGLVKVGTATATRQTGRTFELAAPPHGGSFQLRGVVEFQWRHGSKVLLSTTRPTSSGHPSAAGAIPRGFSAATCTVS